VCDGGLTRREKLVDVLTLNALGACSCSKAVSPLIPMCVDEVGERQCDVARHQHLFIDLNYDSHRVYRLASYFDMRTRCNIQCPHWVYVALDGTAIFCMEASPIPSWSTQLRRKFRDIPESCM